MGYVLIDMTGRKCGRWTIVSRAPNRGSAAAWNVVCECGNASVVLGRELRSGRSTSCGCYHAEERASVTGPAHSRYRHGRWTKEERAARKAQMKPACEICGGTKKLCYDHNHKTGAYRGTLCDACNRALGFMGDSAERLAAAAKYLHERSDYSSA